MTLLTTDGRGRATLGRKDSTYRVTDLGDGSLLLEPVTTYTKAELALLLKPGLLDAVSRSMSKPDEGVAYRRRSQSRST